LWFDVEERYKTIRDHRRRATARLWFDVEERYKTISFIGLCAYVMLWFDVEERYKTMIKGLQWGAMCCGLM